MKMYVTFYEPVKPGDAGYVAKRNWTDYKVGFNALPTWTMTSGSEADNQTRILQSLRVHMPDGHHCNITIDELGPEEFAVCCSCHPESATARAESTL